ncbi:MAG: glycosyltransferase family 2 protein [Proteobacteria bacterium]|nr:glycosyltransferase family 2 protein [Pseudomonadota bacterium]
MQFSLVIACYKDAPHLKRNTLALCDYLDRTRYTYEMVFVDDGSPDQSADEIRETIIELQGRGIPHKAIFLDKNQGRGAAVTRGIRESTGEIVGYIDIDLEPLMDGLLPMIQLVERGEADLVTGRRVIANAIAKPIRVLSSYVYRWIAHLALPLPVADTECGLKVFRRTKIMSILNSCTDKRWFWDTEIIHRSWTAGLAVREHWIVFYEDQSKASTVRLIPDTWAYLKAIQKYRRQLKSALAK